MTYPLTTLTYAQLFDPAVNLSTGTAIVQDYNLIQSTLNEVMGLNPNGYGIPWLYSSPVNTGTRISAQQWNDLKLDLNTAHLHIYNTETATFSFITGTVLALIPGADISTGTLTTSKHNLMYEASQSILANRYTCHPSQYFGDENGNVTRVNGISTRTEVWGVGNDLEIYHTVHAVFATADAARYFFNSGGVFTWDGFWNQEAQSDIDLLWQGFISYIQLNENYEYNRTKFLATGTTTTSYTSGTLQINIVAGKTLTGTYANREIVFTTTFKNNDVGTLFVVPNFAKWEFELP